MRDLGWVSINRVTADAGSRNHPRKDRKRVEKTVYVETKTIRTPQGVQQIRLISQGGRIGLGEVTESGKSVFRLNRNTDHHPGEADASVSPPGGRATRSNSSAMSQASSRDAAPSLR